MMNIEQLGCLSIRIGSCPRFFINVSHIPSFGSGQVPPHDLGHKTVSRGSMTMAGWLHSRHWQVKL